MINIQKALPNELLYVPLGNLQPFVSDLEIPKKQLLREKNKISVEINASVLPEIVFDQESCKYLVVGGYTTYFAYKSLYKPNRLVRCKAFYQLSEEQRYLLTIDWMMKNNVTNWYNRHKIITKLISGFKYTKEELATYLNKGNRDIQFYLDPPVNVKQNTIKQEQEKIINKISLEAFKNSHNKDYLYILVLYFGEKITQEKLDFIRWIRGNNIKFEECELTLEQEHQLIDKALNLKDEFLTEIKILINDMRIRNGQKPIF
ncbi:hypothetical protein ACLIA0_10105 [Bacillaceae bacterium W0354]